MAAFVAGFAAGTLAACAVWVPTFLATGRRPRS